jgi:hypothetical protein
VIVSIIVVGGNPVRNALAAYALTLRFAASARSSRCS